MKTIELEKRALKGKKCKKIIKEGKIPCVIYNSKGDSRECQIEKGVGEKLIKNVTSSTMTDVEYEGKKMKALVKDVDMNPRTDLVRHISFFEIDENVESTYEIPFTFVGVSPAVKNSLGVLIQTTNSIEVKCKSKDLVPQISVDISTLENIGDSILVQDIEIPKGMTITDEEVKTYTVATITELQKQVEVEEETTDEEGEEGEVKEEGGDEDKGEEKKEE